ncbi:MAG: hypothetical protein ABSH53_05115 [Holophaga sp.]|jgi:hypothetical protein
MKVPLKLAVPTAVVILAGLACATPRPIVPERPVPPGSVLFMFTRRVAGPVDLAIDGTRVPVAKATRKKCGRLTVSGLAPGPHRFVLLSPVEAFGPDQIAIDLGPARGEFRVLFAQDLKAVLYGSPEPAPAAAGIPGVQARLEP